MKKFRSKLRLRSRAATAALATAAVAAVAFGAPAGAPGAEIPLCGGSLEINNDIPGIDPPGGLSYKFDCNAAVVGYALLSSRQIDYFSTEVGVLDFASGEATAEQFSCEGAFPGSGFGCRGIANFGNFVVGEFAIGRDPCEVAKTKADKFKVWVAATIIQFDSVTKKPFTAVTQPFRLKGPKCDGSAATSKSKSKSKRRHPQGRV